LNADAVDLRQEIIRVNNNLNMSIFGIGLRKQRVVIIEDKILITADHKRIPALASLDRKNRLATRFIDVAILDEYKTRLHHELKTQLGLPVRCVLKDYDPECELAVTVIVLEEGFLKKEQKEPRE